MLIGYPFSVRDSTITTGDNRKTGLVLSSALVIAQCKTLATSPVNITGGALPTIVEIGEGQYAAFYDPEANGEAMLQMDAGTGLTNPSDRYIDIVMGRDSSRIQSAINATGKIVEVVLVDTLTTYTANTPQTGDLFAAVNPMVVSHVFTTASLVNAPTGGGGGSFPSTAPANWLTSAAFATGTTIPHVTLVDTATLAVITTNVTNPVQTATPQSGIVVSVTSNPQTVTVSGLPTGLTYATLGAQNQKLMRQTGGEARMIANQTISGSNYVFTFGTGIVELGPFSVIAPGDVVYPMP